MPPSQALQGNHTKKWHVKHAVEKTTSTKTRIPYKWNFAYLIQTRWYYITYLNSKIYLLRNSYLILSLCIEDQLLRPPILSAFVIVHFTGILLSTWQHLLSGSQKSPQLTRGFWANLINVETTSVFFSIFWTIKALDIYNSNSKIDLIWIWENDNILIWYVEYRIWQYGSIGDWEISSNQISAMTPSGIHLENAINSWANSGPHL